MRTSRKLTTALLSLFALLLISASAMAADPGLPYPATSEVSDQKAGSLLVYNYYTSSFANSTTNNTRFNITNTSSTAAVAVHLFFIAGSQSCLVADAFICLTQNQTATFTALDSDPDATGYVIAFAVNASGCPIQFNFLIGDEYIKAGTAGARAANLGAEAFAAIGTPAGPCDANSADTLLRFDGALGSYNRVPRVLAASSLGSINDGNDIFLVINRIGGSLLTGSSSLGTLFGIVYDDAELPYSFNLPTSTCQVANVISSTFPRTAPRIGSIIRTGSTGWLKIYSTSDFGILGAIITTNSFAGTQQGAFSGGRNLHKLTLSGAPTLSVPVFPPSCPFPILTGTF